MLFAATVLLAVFGTAVAECPNACSAHGKCGAYDMCTCYRNWMTNDCSERICQFGLAHVDTPKGDLDASSGELTAPNTTVVENSAMYPDGTTEQFPLMVDSDQTTLDNTAHYYMECANKGLCDRQSGECQCFDGYTGSACQRAACPDTGSGVCSGHGTCENIKTIAKWDFDNIYKLWDEAATMGCVCDGGYQGANCEEKICKYGADPLYQDSYQTIRYSNWTYSIYTTNSSATVTGNYSLVFTDSTGETWRTDPIDIGATCATLTDTLESLPNNVMELDTVLCQAWTTDYHRIADTSLKNWYEPVDTSSSTMHSKFTIAFPMNVGETKNMAIDMYLDGTRPTLYTDEPTSTIGSYIYNNGFYGENYDYVPDLCTGVVVSLNSHTSLTYDYLDSLTTAETILLKKCLGDSDGNTDDNTEIYNWDYGDSANPHLIKLIDATQDQSAYTDADATHYVPTQVSRSYLCNQNDATLSSVDGMCERADPPGFYAVIYWDNANSLFKIFGRPWDDHSQTTTYFHVYTTTGTLQLVSNSTVAFNTWLERGNQDDLLLSNTLYTQTVSNGGRSNLDCETRFTNETCLEKGDLFMVLNTGLLYAGDASPDTVSAGHAANAIYPQIYEVKKIGAEPVTLSDWGTTDGTDWTTGSVPSFVRTQIVADKPFNTNFHLDTVTAASDTSAAVFKFTIPSNAYNYAAPCANRGVCDHNTGMCSCFAGFTGDNCDTINALATGTGIQ